MYTYRCLCITGLNINRPNDKDQTMRDTHYAEWCHCFARLELQLTEHLSLVQVYTVEPVHNGQSIRQPPLKNSQPPWPQIAPT